MKRCIVEATQAVSDLTGSFRDAPDVEAAYWRTTGIFPIMHIVAIRGDVYERNRWVAMNLYKAFGEPLDRAEIAERQRPGWRPRRDRPVAAPGGDEPGAVGDEPTPDSLDRPPNGMILPAKFDAEGRHDAGDVTATEDGVAPRHGDERADWVGVIGEPIAHFRVPGLLDPRHHRQRQILLVGEEVIQGSARIAGLACHALQHQVGVPVAGQPTCRCLQQRAPRPGAPIGLGRPTLLRGGLCCRHLAPHTCMCVCYHSA